ncbi:MAG: lamin tail domain-containing protein [Anaerolineae bacterium]
MCKRILHLNLAFLGSALLLLIVVHTPGFILPTRAAPFNTAAPGDVVINEVAWMGTAASTYDEWIELYNTTEQTIPLTGWHLYAADFGPTLTLEGEIEPLGYYLIERSDDDTVGDISADWVGPFSGGSLDNDGEILYLDDASGGRIDTANVEGGSWPAGDNATKQTMERIDPRGPDTSDNWCTNDGVTHNGEDADGNPINGTPKAPNSCYVSSEPAPQLNLVKTGPAAVAPRTLFTYHIAFSNTGTLTATNVVLTDTLPTGLATVAQTSPYSFTAAGQTLRWDVGELPTATLGQIALVVSQTEALAGHVTNHVTATADVGQGATSAWTTDIVPDVRLYALQPGNYGDGGEAAALINLSADAVPLNGWCLGDRVSFGTRACFPAGAEIAPREILWLAEDNAGFTSVWGFEAHWAVTQSTTLLEGHWPGFTDDGKTVYVLDDRDNVVDTLAYGKGSTDVGWTGASVPHPYAGYNDKAQVLYRKLDQATGRPVPDTDSAADWAQDPADPHDGRKVRYPGWDLEALFFPAEIATTHAVTVAVAPDAGLDVVSRTLASARDSILLQGYAFESVALYETLEARLQAGVAVTLLLESKVVGGIADDEKWIVDQIDAHPNGSVYFMGGDVRRYRYQHAKFIVVDGKRALVSTDNFTPRSMPADRLDNGTRGHRGVLFVTEAPGVVARLQALFARDCDLTRLDVARYGEDFAAGLAPPTGYEPLPEPDWTTYTAVFSRPLVATATHFTVMHAPEHSLRDGDALLGLLNRADSGDEILGLQLNEPLTWTWGVGAVGRNPRVQALIEAARRGASVRLLLDAYYDEPQHVNKNTATCVHLNAVAAAEGLTLTCRLANVTGLGVHAKVFLVDLGTEQWVHVGSLNGSETSNKVNREVAVQAASPALHAYLQEVFEYDWVRSHGPMVHRVLLPLVFRDYAPPAAYPLFTEVYINPSNPGGGDETLKEWMELYNPTRETFSLQGWTVGDALSEGDYGDGRYAFPEGAGLSPAQVVIVAACAGDFSAAYGRNPDYEWLGCDDNVPDLTPVGAWEGFGPALGNTQDEVLLHDATGALVDSVAWGGVARADVIPFVDFEAPFPTGGSLERSPAYSDRDDCSRDFRVRYTPQPGEIWAP